MSNEKNKKVVISYPIVPIVDFSPITQQLSSSINVFTEPYLPLGESLSQNKPIIESITTSLRNFGENLARFTEPGINLTYNLGKGLIEFSTISAPWMKSVEASLAGITEMFRGLSEDPESIFNFFEYEKALNSFYWSMPYEMNGKKLKQIIKLANNEHDFDLQMSRYFSRQKMDRLFNEIMELLPRKKRKLLSQIQKAFNDKSYQLINGPIISLIDDTLGQLVTDRKDTNRVGILVPILEDLNDKISAFDGQIYVYLEMLSNNVTCIFENVDLNGVFIIRNEKKIRRHAIQHGKSAGSNRRIESIMLINTLFNTLKVANELSDYYGRLSYQRGFGYKIKEST